MLYRDFIFGLTQEQFQALQSDGLTPLPLPSGTSAYLPGIVIISQDPPTSPLSDQLWWDKDTETLSRWDQASGTWKTASGSGSSDIIRSF